MTDREEIQIPDADTETSFKEQFRKSIFFLGRSFALIVIIWVAFSISQELNSYRPFILTFMAFLLGLSLSSKFDDISD